MKKNTGFRVYHLPFVGMIGAGYYIIKGINYKLEQKYTREILNGIKIDGDIAEILNKENIEHIEYYR